MPKQKQYTERANFTEEKKKIVASLIPSFTSSNGKINWEGLSMDEKVIEWNYNPRSFKSLYDRESAKKDSCMHQGLAHTCIQQKKKKNFRANSEKPSESNCTQAEKEKDFMEMFSPTSEGLSDDEKQTQDVRIIDENRLNSSFHTPGKKMNATLNTGVIKIISNPTEVPLMFKPITATSDTEFYWVFTEPEGIKMKVSKKKDKLVVEVNVSDYMKNAETFISSKRLSRVGDVPVEGKDYSLTLQIPKNVDETTSVLKRIPGAVYVCFQKKDSKVDEYEELIELNSDDE